MNSIDKGREFLKATTWEEDKFISDQQKGLPFPPQQRPHSESSGMIDLISPDKFSITTSNLLETFNKRRSRRNFSDDGFTLEEFSYLLWCTQGVQKISDNGINTLRTVPSAGARHPFETYLFVRNITGLDKGIYRYLPLDHKIYLHRKYRENMENEITKGCLNQKFAANCAVCFIWTAVPYRTEWRYSILSAKIIAIDAGHLCQNLYLASEAIGAGTCGIAAYSQSRMDGILGVNGKDEFVIYIAPVGKPV